MTAAERLLFLSKSTGTAAALLLAIGVGATTGEALNDYSPIDAGAAAEHLLSEKSNGAGKNKRSRVIIGDKEYFLTPFETADLLIQRAKQRKEKVSVKQDNIVVIPEKRDKILSSKPVTIESSHFDLHAQINANYAFIDRLRKEFQRLEQIEIARLLEEDDEECLMLLL